MNITSGQKKAAIIGAAALLIAGAAFVYFDPLGLDLLGEKGSAAVVKPVATPRVAMPAAKPPAAAAKVAATPAQTIAPAAPSAAPTQAVATPAKAAAPVAPAPAATPVIAAPVVTPPAVAPVQAPQPPLKLAKTIKTVKAKPERSMTADLRHCLELETDAAIAKCAGE